MRDFDIIGWLIRLWFAIAGALVCVLVIVSVRTVYHNVQESNCHSFGRNTNHDVRFITNGYFDFDCYVNTSNGWVTRDQLRSVNGAD